MLPLFLCNYNWSYGYCILSEMCTSLQAELLGGLVINIGVHNFTMLTSTLTDLHYYQNCSGGGMLQCSNVVFEWKATIFLCQINAFKSYVGRILWIRAIYKLSCTNYKFIICAAIYKWLCKLWMYCIVL